MNKLLFALAPAIFVGLPCFSSANAAQPVCAVDVKSFDVGGVKTGMSIEEARAAMQKNFGVSSDKIRVTKSGKNHVSYAVTGSEQVQYLVYENNGTRMQVSFEPRVPYDKNNPMAAALINYEVPWTKDNETAMNQAASAKYGPVATGSIGLLWCEKPIRSSGMGCEIGSAELSLGGTKLKLIDPAWQNARIKFMDQQKSTKPQF